MVQITKTPKSPIQSSTILRKTQRKNNKYRTHHTTSQHHRKTPHTKIKNPKKRLPKSTKTNRSLQKRLPLMVPPTPTMAHRQKLHILARTITEHQKAEKILKFNK